jgi:ubiquinone/menaquinone biosynthesis C-methylase UbiE
MVNISNVLAWITGNARNTSAMKQRIKLGYESACTDHVTMYDDQGLKHYTKVANKLLEEVDLQGKEVVDVGCGTGILSLRVLEQGAAKVVCGDFSKFMLDQCQTKVKSQGNNRALVDFSQLDAENLPYYDNSLDVVVSGMMLGLVPNQKKTVIEMIRVLRHGGTLAFSIHGPKHYWEANDATIRASNKRFVFGYRIEFWPRKEKYIQNILSKAGLIDIQIRRFTWQDDFMTGSKAYDFFASTTALWWYSKFPRDKIAEDSQNIRDYFDRKNITKITQDIILAYGKKV